MHRQAVHRGRVSYVPNRLGGGCLFQAGAAGFVSFPEPVKQDELRGHPEKFAEHYNQATLFFNSQTPEEQAHIAGAFRFELSKVTVPAVRTRMLGGLVNVSRALAAQVADGLGMDVPDAMPRAIERVPKAEVKASPALSMLARPGEPGVRSRKFAILVADGVNGKEVETVQRALLDAGAVARLMGVRIGPCTTDAGEMLDADVSLENEPGVLFDGMIVPDGADRMGELRKDARTLDYLKEQYRHCKALLVFGDGGALLESAGIPATLPNGDEDPGLIVGEDARSAIRAYIEFAGRRHWVRETDPPRV